MRRHQSNFRIEKMAEILQFSRSGYYQFLQRPKRTIDEVFLKKIKTIFNENKGRYGAPRIHEELKKQNIKSSRYQVEKLMRMHNLSSDRRKKRVKTTRPLKNGKDLIKRDFKAEKPNQKWCSDISYLPTRKGFVYLAVILDLYSRKVVGAWSAPRLNRTTKFALKI